MKFYLLGLVALTACTTLVSCSDDESDGRQPASDTSCSDDENDGGQPASDTYVVIGNAESRNGTASYVVTAESLDEGTVSVRENGYETDYAQAATWMFYKDKYVYRLAYNRGSAGTTAAFYLDDNGKIQARTKEYNIKNFTTEGIFGTKIIAAASSVTDEKDQYGNAAYGINFSIIDVEEENLRTRSIMAEDFLGNKEYVTFSGILEANGKIYTAVVPIGCSPYGVAAGGVLEGNEDLIEAADGGTGGGMFTSGTLPGTQYPNECWIAIYDDETFTNPKIVHTNQMSYASGRMRSAYYQTIWAADNGDVYVFSPSYAKINEDSRLKTCHNSGVMRIKAGAEEFDDTYEFFDIEKASEGNPIYRCWHITEDYFLLQMYTQGLNIRGTGVTRLAIYKGEDRKFTYVTGLPDPDVISSFSKEPYNENGMCYTTVVTTDGESPTIYKIDPKTATATAGLKVTSDEIVGVGRLRSK